MESQTRKTKGYNDMATCYRCGNKFGDACEFAQKKHIFSEEELRPPMDGGSRKCPGKTISGKDCGTDLVSLPCRGRGRSGNGNGGKRLIVAGMGIVAGAALVLALLLYWLNCCPEQRGTFAVAPNPLVFPYSDDFRSSASMELHNGGDEVVRIERIELPSPLFSVSGLPLELPPAGSKSLLVHYEGRNSNKVESHATLYSDTDGLAKTIRLVANRSPWWVYDSLDKQSTMLRSEP